MRFLLLCGRSIRIRLFRRCIFPSRIHLPLFVCMCCIMPCFGAMLQSCLLDFFHYIVKALCFKVTYVRNPRDFLLAGVCPWIFTTAVSHTRVVRRYSQWYIVASFHSYVCGFFAISFWSLHFLHVLKPARSHVAFCVVFHLCAHFFYFAVAFGKVTFMVSVTS